MNNKYQLHRYRKRIPFLQQISDKIYFHLGISEFYFPDEEMNNLRITLEKALGSYVMTYQLERFDLTLNIAQHLCAHLKDAQLSAEQIINLHKYEALTRAVGISFVVYQKPIVLQDVVKSNLYTLYKEKKLL